jgi:hypothetical protein
MSQGTEMTKSKCKKVTEAGKWAILPWPHDQGDSAHALGQQVAAFET